MFLRVTDLLTPGKGQSPSSAFAQEQCVKPEAPHTFPCGHGGVLKVFCPWKSVNHPIPPLPPLPSAPTSPRPFYPSGED